jgi:membrane protease subunit (stomatin/prohibitin family)
MGLVLLTERHVRQIAGVLSCYDRVIVQGTLPVFCYADGMTAYLSKRGIRIFDFTQFAKPLTDAIKLHAEELAAANGLTIDYVRKKNFRKEDRVQEMLQKRGDHPGLV